MSTVSRFRTQVQQAAFDRAVSVGYVHNRDSDYTLRAGRSGGPVRAGCLIVLFGRVVGYERAMIIYPDGSVVTQEPKRGGSRSVSFDKRKLSAALATHGVMAMRQGRGYVPSQLHYADEDSQFT